jgi:hypothetical protein
MLNRSRAFFVARVLSDQRSAISDQRSAISGQLSAVSQKRQDDVFFLSG